MELVKLENREIQNNLVNTNTDKAKFVNNVITVRGVRIMRVYYIGTCLIRYSFG